MIIIKCDRCDREFDETSVVGSDCYEIKNTLYTFRDYHDEKKKVYSKLDHSPMFCYDCFQELKRFLKPIPQPQPPDSKE